MIKTIKKVGSTKLGDVTIGQYSMFTLGFSVVCGAIAAASYLIANAIDDRI